MAVFDPERILKVFASNEVEYVLIGALAARLQGFPRMTADADITPSSDYKNIENLALALNEIDARIFTDNVPNGLSFDCSAETLLLAETWNLITVAGRLDIVFTPAGTTGYEDLKQSAIQFQVYGIELWVADLKDIVRSKKASDRPQDRQDIIILNEIIKRNKSGEE
ncbi:MAG: hypothetical protein GVY07_09550 [Bacteroidetes bacterium]|jgi:hypothetical protein|nr:hypothetical protein [Bacteroidota bacterium]